MLRNLFRRGDNAGRTAALGLYEQIVAAARQPRLYEAWNVPDTPLGRFEMMSLHMVLFLHRVRGETGAISDVAQILTDEFFQDVDHSLRELGISDMGVPKRIKKLARMFYGRAKSYSDALDADDLPALQEALARNVRPGVTDWAETADLAAYMKRTVALLSTQPVSALQKGDLRFETRSED